MKLKVMLLVLFLCAAGSAIIAPSAWGEATPQRVEITAQQFLFQPGEVTVKAGQPVVLVLKSLDVGHGLRILDLRVDLKVKAGETAEVMFTPNKPGDFIGHCSVFCGASHGSMTFLLHVVA